MGLPGLLWAGPWCAGPSGAPLGPNGPHWALMGPAHMGQALMNPPALVCPAMMDQARIGLLGPSWAGTSWTGP